MCRGNSVGVVVLWACGWILVGCDGDDPKPPTSPTSVQLDSLTVTPTRVVGTIAAQGSATLSAAPTAGTVVTLTSTSPAAAVPAMVTIPAGATTATFSITTTPVGALTTATIRGTVGEITKSADLAIDGGPCVAVPGPEILPLVVYGGQNNPANRFIPSGFFGDANDLRIDLGDRSNPPVGDSNIRIDYTPRGPQRFAGIFWQCPENNFGTVANAGFNLTRARRVRFWARASRASRAEFKVGGLGRAVPPQPFPDTFDATSTSPVVVDLGTDWREFTIDVSGRDLTRVIGGFLFVTNTTQNPTAVAFFIANVIWE